MIKSFDTVEKYNTYTNNGENLKSGILYYVRENNSAHFYTSEIDGILAKYDTGGTGTVSGNINIVENGSNINVAPYATATVNVPIPQGYIQPTGNKEITDNGSNIDIAQYATVSVNVAVQSEDVILGNIIERDINSIIIPDGVTTIGNFVFTDCTNLTSIIIPDGVTSIGEFAFSGCTSLTNITIPDSVISIGDHAFSGCSGITSIIVSDGVTSIGNGAFDCYHLESITIQATTPPTLGCCAIPSNCSVFVPLESVDIYKRDWSEYAEQIQAI